MQLAPWCLLLGLASCTGGTLAHVQDQQRQRDYAFQEMRTELGDLRHAMQACRTELQILGERLTEQEHIAKNVARNKPQNDQTQAMLAACERRLAIAEKSLEKISSEMRSLSKHADRTNLSLASFKEKRVDCQRELSLHKQKIEGISQLKSTLGQISQAMSERSSTSALSQASYRVKPGDTLEKIARRNSISVAELKRLNNITQDKIIVGQELKIAGSGE